MSATLLPAPAAVDVGVYPNVPMAEYHQWPAASNSRLSRLRRSPAHLKAYMDEPPEDTKALVIGRSVHTTILEPALFDSTFTVATQCTALTKGGTPCANNGSRLHMAEGWLCGIHQKGVAPSWVDTKQVLTEADYTTCLGIRRTVFAHRSAAKLLEGAARVELSLKWVDRESGVLCKGRPDVWSPGIAGGALVDVKSARDAGLREFERSIFTHGYHRQAAFYLDACEVLGIHAEHFVIIAVEKEPPYAVAVYRLSEGAIDAGREQLKPLLPLYRTCMETNTWPAYPDEVRDIALPNWAWAQIDEEAAA